MEQDQGKRQQGMVDLLEIYHARKLQEHILDQLRRLQSDKQQLPLVDIARKRDVVRYYEAMLLTVSELLYESGDCV